MYEFNRKKPVSINLSCPLGSVDIVSERRNNIKVAITALDSSRQDRESVNNTSVVLINDELIIEPPKGSSYLRSSTRLNIKARVPIDSSAKINVASAVVNCDGRYKDLNITTASGEIYVEDITGNLTLKTATANSQIGDVGGKLTARSASGNITFGHVAGKMIVRSGSGNIKIATSSNDIKYKSNSGDLNIVSVNSGLISCQSESGSIRIGINPDTIALLNLNSKTGEITDEIDTQRNIDSAKSVTLHLNTNTGDIHVFEALAESFQPKR